MGVYGLVSLAGKRKRWAGPMTEGPLSDDSMDDDWYRFNMLTVGVENGGRQLRRDAMHDATIRDHNFNHGEMSSLVVENKENKVCNPRYVHKLNEWGCFKAFTSILVHNELANNDSLVIELAGAPPGELYRCRGSKNAGVLPCLSYH